MKNFIVLFIISCSLLLSCQEHGEFIDSSLRIGNLYCSDGSVINPEAYAGSGKTAIAAIFWVNNSFEATTDRALAVSLDNLPPVVWAELLEDIDNVSSELNAFKGASNTASIMIWGEDKNVNTPASTNAYNYSKYGVSSWFLPSVAEAGQIHLNKAALYKAFDYCNGEDFNKVWYWTSTQDGTGSDTPIFNALAISLTEGRVTGSGKMNIFAIRPIIAIK